MADGIYTIETGGVIDITFSPDNTRLYVALANGTIDLFDVTTQQKLATWGLGVTPGAINIAQDGSYLLVNDAKQPIIYRLDTASGRIADTYVGQGNVFTDVEVISGNRAILTGDQPTVLDLSTGAFSPLASIGNSIINSDGRLTLLGVQGLSTGSLYVLDETTTAIIARVDAYQARDSGFNRGAQAINQAAGKLAQAVSRGSINVYDLNANQATNHAIGPETVGGLSFNASGSHVYAYLLSGAVVEYDTASFQEITRFAATPTNAASGVGSYGNSMLITADERYAIITAGYAGPAQILDLATAPHLISGTIGQDTLTGTTANDVLAGGNGADILSGGGGNDIFRGTLSELVGDRITDLSVGDRIRVTDADLSTLSYVRNGTTLTIQYSPTVASSLNIGNPTGRLVTVAADLGVDLIIAPRMSGLNDFDSNGHSDILWRNVSGAVSTWQVSGNVVGNQVQQSVYNTTIDTGWKIVETADFNGDARSDILWRNVNGSFSIWNGNRGGGFVQGSYTNDTVGKEWRIAAVGDVNGDGRDDLLWQKDDGAISTWLSTGSGFAANAYYHGSPGNGWLVEGLADFDGDGRADILWRNTNGGLSAWLANAEGFQDGGYFTTVPTAWHVDGLGDFNGDGRSDILWRNDNGGVSLWLSNGAGFDQGTYNTSVPTSWNIAQVGDFNGDGRADILWRNDNGAVSTWQSNGRGFDQSVYNSSAPTSWSVAAHDFVL